MRSDRFGPVGFVVGLAIAALGMTLYQDWWTIAFALGGATVAVLASRLSPARSLAVGLAVSGSVLLAGLGLFLVVMGSLFGNAVPCVDCPSRPPTFLFLGLGAIGAALVLAILASWTIRRRPRRDPR